MIIHENKKSEIVEIINYYQTFLLSPPTSSINLNVEKSKLVDESKKDLENAEKIFWIFMKDDFNCQYACNKYYDGYCMETMFASTKFWNYISPKIQSLVDKQKDATPNGIQSLACGQENSAGAAKGRCHYILDVFYPFYQELSEAKQKAIKNGEDWKNDVNRNEKKYIEIKEKYLEINEEKVIKNGCLLGNYNVAKLLRLKFTFLDYYHLDDKMISTFKMLAKNNLPFALNQLGDVYFEKENFVQAIECYEGSNQLFKENIQCCNLAKCYRNLSSSDKLDLMTNICRIGALDHGCSTCSRKLVKHYLKHIGDKEFVKLFPQMSELCHLFHQAGIERDCYHYYDDDLSEFSSGIQDEKREKIFENLKKLYKGDSNNSLSEVDLQREYLRMMKIIETSSSSNDAEYKDDGIVKIARKWAKNVVQFLTTQTNLSPTIANEKKHALAKKQEDEWIKRTPIILTIFPVDIARIVYNYLFAVPSFYNFQHPLRF
jgi:tetratricopeptide (TPR) repeat protein